MAEQASKDEPTGIAVFTPSPIYTVTIEDEGDDCEVHFHAGGQGFWVARMAVLLDERATLCGPFAGESGRVLRVLMQAEGVRVRATAASRPNGGYVHDRRGGERREIAETRSPDLSRHETDDLYNAALTTGLSAKVTVLTGPRQPSVIKPDVYRRLASDLSSNGVLVVADLSGDALAALEGGVDLLKVSHVELVEGGFSKDERPASLAAAAAVFLERGIRNVIVSRAEDPALLFLDGRTYELHALKLHPADHRGAGDSMTAASAVGLARGWPIERAVRLGGAAGALNVTRHGLATGDRRDIEALLDRIELRSVAR
jgi:1-phosphofructokinase